MPPTITANSPAKIPATHVLLVLFGFPIISTLLSLLLLKKEAFTAAGFDFILFFWILVTVWYLVQIQLISRILKKARLNWEFVNYSLNNKQTLFFIGVYLVVGFGIVAFIEISLANMQVDPARLASISSLIPKTTTARILFVIMGLTAGISEEIVYRGFAIRALESHRVNKWLAIALAAIPFIFQHGLKSIDQFWWFLVWGLVFGIILLLTKRLYITIIIHWMVILSALFGVFQAVQ
jgi:hypothetical protein